MSLLVVYLIGYFLMAYVYIYEDHLKNKKSMSLKDLLDVTWISMFSWIGLFFVAHEYAKAWWKQNKNNPVIKFNKDEEE